MANNDVKTRKRRTFTLEEKLDRINEQIFEKEESLKNLKEQKKQIEKEIHDKKMAELEQLITGSGMTLEQIKELIEKSK